MQEEPRYVDVTDTKLSGGVVGDERASNKCVTGDRFDARWLRWIMSWEGKKKKRYTRAFHGKHSLRNCLSNFIHMNEILPPNRYIQSQKEVTNSLQTRPLYPYSDPRPVARIQNLRARQEVQGRGLYRSHISCVTHSNLNSPPLERPLSSLHNVLNAVEPEGWENYMQYHFV